MSIVKASDREARFKIQMGKLRLNFMASSVTNETMLLYWEQLNGWDMNTLSMAVDRLIRTRSEPYFPTVGEINDACRQCGETRSATGYLPEPPPTSNDDMKFQALMFGTIGYCISEKDGCPDFGTDGWWKCVREYAARGWRWGNDKKKRKIKVKTNISMEWVESMIGQCKSGEYWHRP